MGEIRWKGIEDIRHHGADWCVVFERAMDDLPPSTLAGVVKRINEVIEAAYTAGVSPTRNEEP